MPTPDVLERQMREQREFWVELDDKLAVKLRRPPETGFGQFGTAGRITVDDVVECACGWRGFREATLLGESVGAEDAIDFHKGLWAEFIRDRVKLAGKCIERLTEAVTGRMQEFLDAEKNS